MAPARAQVAARSEVAISADFFGVGNASRPGEWTGVRLRLTDSSDRARAVAVRITHPHMDPDGDTGTIQREVTLNPGVAQSVWLYFRAPWSTDPASLFTVTIAALGVDLPEDGVGVGAGSQIGAARIQPAQVVSSSSSMIGVLGRSPAGGLSAYPVRALNLDHPGTAHELTEVITDLSPLDLPDRWMGLRQFESILWLAGEPGELTDRQADAVREWVMRGGHLVISIPSVGQSWTSPRNNPLHALLPAVTIERSEQTELAPIASILTPRDPASLPARGTLHALRPADGAEASDASVLLRGEDGTPIVVRRALGAGMVTLIGVDLSDPAIALRVDPQFFWHRILGKRFDVLTRDQMQSMSQSKAGEFRLRETAWLDSDVPSQIVKEGRASVGVLLGLFVFALYLLLAGPIGFAFLKRKGQVQHAWLSFLAVAGLFTMIAWGGATALRPTRSEIQHLTFLDHVYGQPVQAASVWFSALLPGYADRTLSVGDPQLDTQWTQAIFPWEDPATQIRRRFPDSRPYVIDTRTPQSITVPARSTVKQLRAEWLGGPRWTMPTPLDGELALRQTEAGLRIVGRLSHQLPGPLRNTKIILVHRQKPLIGSLGGGGPLLSVVSAWSLAGPWEGGAVLDLESLAIQSASDGDKFLGDLSRYGRGGLSTTGQLKFDVGRLVDRLEALSLYSVMGQPDYRQAEMTIKTLLQRRETHGADISAWFTQPCIIILGQLEDEPSPVPLFIDGDAVSNSGRTVIRWVYPLASNPPDFGGR